MFDARAELLDEVMLMSLSALLKRKKSAQHVEGPSEKVEESQGNKANFARSEECAC